MTASSAESFGASGAAASAQMFVINLAASTSPMALSNPSSPELKRFTFFVSRQREEGRERFRLHMGYFATQDEAEALLPSVRDIYPAAWAGPAPTTGMGRRGRIAPGSVVSAAPAPAAKPAPASPAAPAVTVAAAPSAPASVPAAVTRLVPAAARAPAAAPGKPALDSMSNVRDVLAQLSEPATAPRAPAAQAPAPEAPVARPVAAKPAAAPAAAKGLELSSTDALSLLESPVARPAPMPAAPVARAVPVAAPVAAAPSQAKSPMPSLPPLKNPFEGLENEPEVRLVTPEDTQTLTDIKLDRQNNAPPCFAVQLIWSVMPVDVATLPHLAIFEAYTLYNVEGNRQGRKWYGLRLGFFTDPNSATQVANYVRSDYKNVAVVPVAVKERDRARGGATATPEAGSEPQKTTDADFRREGMEGFELLADDRPPPAKLDLDDTVRARAPVIGGAAQRPNARVAPKLPVAAPTAAAGAPKATGKPTGKRVVVRRRPPTPPPGKTVSAGVGGAEVLESTLEILGASTLSLDDGGRETITDAAARKAGTKKASGNRFSRLLSKLSGG